MTQAPAHRGPFLLHTARHGNDFTGTAVHAALVIPVIVIVITSPHIHTADDQDFIGSLGPAQI